MIKTILIIDDIFDFDREDLEIGYLDCIVWPWNDDERYYIADIERRQRLFLVT